MNTENRHIRHPPAFDKILDRIDACEDWDALGAVLRGTDAHWKAIGLTAEEVDLIAMNAKHRSTKVPESQTDAYADEQMARRKKRA
ncbi:hypothetical protein CMI37_31170 [Candidatus Pacearchaeota archaeon]|nr:hypothetical protein [Candidatus Pacearchaeota archaeon]